MHTSNYKTAFSISLVAVFALGFMALNLYQSNRQFSQRLKQVEDQLNGLGQTMEADSSFQERNIAGLKDAATTIEQSGKQADAKLKDSLKGQNRINSSQDLELRTLNSYRLTQEKLIADLNREIQLMKRGNDRMERDFTALRRTVEMEHSRDLATLERQISELRRGR